MANVQFANQAAGTVAAAIGSGTTSLTFAYAANASAFPTVSGSTYFYLTLIDQYSFNAGLNPPLSREVVKVTNFTGSGAMTIVRGQEGTAAQSWAIGDRMEARVTNQGLIDLTGGGGAPATATFITQATEGGLSQSRKLTAGTAVTLTDGGALGNMTVGLTNMAASGVLGSNSGAGPVAQLTVAQLNTLLGTLVTLGGVTSVSAGTDAAKGAAGTAGKVWLATDTGAIYRDTGAVWFLLEPALTGDVTTSAGAVATTITAAAVTNAKLANMGASTVKGSIAGGVPADLTTTQLTTLINAFSSGLSGAAPASGGGTSNFLRADGTWTTPSASSGLYQNPQVIINGGMLVSQRTGGTSTPINITTSAQYCVDKWTAWASVGAVTSGTIGQTVTASTGRTGYALSVAAYTGTGATTISMRTRLESKDSIRLKNATASFGCLVYQTSGSAQTATVVIRKANSADNFGAVTNIGTSGGTSVSSGGSGTLVTFNNVSMGDCSNGIEIEIQLPIGTNPAGINVQMSEAVLSEGATAGTFPYYEWEDEYQRCLRYYQKTFSYTTAPASSAGQAGTVTAIAAVATASKNVFTYNCPVAMWTSSGTPTFYNPSAAASSIYNFTTSSTVAAANILFKSEKQIQFNETSVGWAAGDQGGVHLVWDQDF